MPVALIRHHCDPARTAGLRRFRGLTAAIVVAISMPVVPHAGQLTVAAASGRHAAGRHDIVADCAS
jgi:hypothetical protein